MIGRAIGFAALLAVALLALWPMRLAGLAGSGLTARAVSGSIWDGRLVSAQLRGLALGDVDAGVAPLPLLAGVVRIGFSGATIRGAILQRRNGLGIADLSGRLLPGKVASLPLAAIDFDNVSLGLSGGACTVTGGRIVVQASGPVASHGAFSGSPRCDGSALVLPLAAADGRSRFEMRVTADGRYRASLALDGVAEADRPGLLAIGFQPTPQGLALAAEGSL